MSRTGTQVRRPQTLANCDDSSGDSHSRNAPASTDREDTDLSVKSVRLGRAPGHQLQSGSSSPSPQFQSDVMATTSGSDLSLGVNGWRRSSLDMSEDPVFDYTVWLSCPQRAPRTWVGGSAQAMRTGHCQERGTNE